MRFSSALSNAQLALFRDRSPQACKTFRRLLIDRPAPDIWGTVHVHLMPIGRTKMLRLNRDRVVVSCKALAYRTLSIAAPEVIGKLVALLTQIAPGVRVLALTYDDGLHAGLAMSFISSVVHPLVALSQSMRLSLSLHGSSGPIELVHHPRVRRAAVLTLRCRESIQPGNPVRSQAGFEVADRRESRCPSALPPRVGVPATGSLAGNPIHPHLASAPTQQGSSPGAPTGLPVRARDL